MDKHQKSEHCVIDSNKDANSIFILDTVNELGTLMQYSYPLQKILLADKSIASRTGHDKVWVPFKKKIAVEKKQMKIWNLM